MDNDVHREQSRLRAAVLGGGTTGSSIGLIDLRAPGWLVAGAAMGVLIVGATLFNTYRQSRTHDAEIVVGGPIPETKR